MRLAIFDIDGTLVGCASERKFWRYLAARGRQGPRQLLAHVLFLLRYLPTGGIHALKKNKAYLSGLDTDEVEALARQFVAERLMDELYEPAVRRLREHLGRGDIVVLISGTLQCIARALADRLNVRHACGTLCCQRDGRFLAQAPELHPFGAAKLTIVRQLATDLGFELADVTAYADSGHDLELLAHVGEPVAVRPDPGLARVARTLNWEVMEERPLAHTLPS